MPKEATASEIRIGIIFDGRYKILLEVEFNPEIEPELVATFPFMEEIPVLIIAPLPVNNAKLDNTPKSIVETVVGTVTDEALRFIAPDLENNLPWSVVPALTFIVLPWDIKVPFKEAPAPISIVLSAIQKTSLAFAPFIKTILNPNEHGLIDSKVQNNNVCDTTIIS